MINTETIFKEIYPNFKIGRENKLLLNTLKKLLHEDDCNNVIRSNQHLKGYDFLDKLLNDLNFKYQITNDAYKNIPSEGKLLIVANHPIGTLDGLALVKLVHSIRSDVRIVANHLLLNVEPLQTVFLPVEVLADKKSLRDTYKVMLEALRNEEAIIIFPAGEVSRLTPIGIRDGEWQTGFIKLARKSRSAILPIRITGRNSAWFYCMSMLYKPLGSLLLFQEMFNKKNKEIQFNIGSPIPYSSIVASGGDDKKISQRVRRHVLNLGKKNKPSLFDTIETVAHPVERKALKHALFRCRKLGETRDNKTIFLYQYQDHCPVMQEIGRLRELTFRAVEEGTGQATDLDKFDVYYSHIVLWDNLNQQIVGSYRVGEGSKILASHGIEGFYTQTLFDLQSEFSVFLPYSIELGRSFVQPAYWGQHSLEYLWYGIGAYLREKPEIKYLFGPLSLSNAYPTKAKEMIIGFYQQQFGSELVHSKARSPFKISETSRQFALMAFNGDYSSSFKVLNSELKKLGVKVPTLYKQYVELCVEKGCHFIDFNIDSDFSNCVDSLIMIEIDKIAPKKRQRYIETVLTDSRVYRPPMPINPSI